MVQLSHPYMTTRKTIALTRRTFVAKVMSLLFKMLSRFVIVFFPRSKHLLLSWLQSPSTVILEPKKIKSVTISIFFPQLSTIRTWIWIQIQLSTIRIWIWIPILAVPLTRCVTRGTLSFWASVFLSSKWEQWQYQGYKVTLRAMHS